ncbi:MAG: FAD-dependent oxidoreductase, partial [Lentisphaerae bacterium]|nr:FAD-dependent oxidoreductase [Lentisphaerota bacterium]
MKIVIVGGVAAGAGAAARLRRLDENAEIILLERGPYISYANCGLPYHIGGVIPERDSLMVMTEQRFRGWFNVDIRANSEVLSIDREKKTVEV